MRFLIVFISVFLYASTNLVDLYRFYGTDKLVKAVEHKLQSKRYWLERLKNRNVKFGYYENCSNLLVCDKEKKILKVYDVDSEGFMPVDEIHVLTGLDGDKEREGDLRTPIGVYRLKTVITNVESYYGPFAFVTTYPNMYDRILHKDGHGIWIHGEPIDGKRDNNNTKGCIVMKNKLLENLRNEINYQKTYLLISEKAPLTATKDEIASILAFIYKWRNAWKNNEFDVYKTFYAKDFRKSDGKDLKRFLSYKKRVFENKRGQKVQIYFRNINIIPYQNIERKKIFRIDMYEQYLSPSYTYKGKKELYVRLSGDKIKIIAEK